MRQDIICQTCATAHRYTPNGIRVYIASPYTIGDKTANANAQIQCAHALMEHDFIPYVPLLSHFWDEAIPREYEDWLAYSIAWIDSCNALLRLPGKSKGADVEVAYAERNLIPVVYSITELIKLNPLGD